MGTFRFSLWRMTSLCVREASSQLSAISFRPEENAKLGARNSEGKKEFQDLSVRFRSRISECDYKAVRKRRAGGDCEDARGGVREGAGEFGALACSISLLPDGSVIRIFVYTVGLFVAQNPRPGNWTDANCSRFAPCCCCRGRVIRRVHVRGLPEVVAGGGCRRHKWLNFSDDSLGPRW